MTTNDRDDDLVQHHLRAGFQVPPLEPEAWEELTRRIVTAAEPLLLARRPRPAWREELLAFARIGVTVAIAASLAALVLLRRVETSASGEAVPASAFLSALAGETSNDTVLDLTLGQAGQSLNAAEGN
jgi:hypothetical protein